jgi:hypothetical protein
MIGGTVAVVLVLTAMMRDVCCLVWNSRVEFGYEWCFSLGRANGRY